MTAIAKSLGIDRLSREQRIALVHEIWDSIEIETTPGVLDAAQRQELAARVAQDDAVPDDVVAWEQVKSQTLARLE